MSNYELYSYLKEHEGTAYTLKELDRRLDLSNLKKKLQSLIKFKYIKVQNAILDYDNYSNARVKYYYVGHVHEYIPRPKILVMAR